MKELTVGEIAEFTKTFTEKDVCLFADATSDFNPVHLDKRYAEKSIFGARVVHGMLTAGLISAVLGNKLPGQGAIYVKQDIKFLAPVFIGDTVTARVEIVEILPDRNRVRLRTQCFKDNGTMVLDGEAIVMPGQ